MVVAALPSSFHDQNHKFVSTIFRYFSTWGIVLRMHESSPYISPPPFIPLTLHETHSYSECTLPCDILLLVNACRVACTSLVFIPAPVFVFGTELISGSGMPAISFFLCCLIIVWFFFDFLLFSVAAKDCTCLVSTYNHLRKLWENKDKQSAHQHQQSSSCDPHRRSSAMHGSRADNAWRRNSSSSLGL